MRLFLIGSLLLTACAAPDEGDDSWDFADGKADGAGSVGYGALGKTKISPSFDTSVMGLAVIDASVMPPDVKAVRKQLAQTRDFVDLFVFAYSTKHGDPWTDIRDELDVGYETLGAFKDLYDRQGVTDPAMAHYDAAELAARRNEVRAWYGDFTARVDDDRTYLTSPSQTKLYVRDRSDLSQFFWGATKLEPALSRSGIKNMAKLTRDLLEHAQDDYDKVLDLRDIHKPANQEHFHDFRKRIRSVARMPGYFPTILDSEVDITDELALVTDAVDRYGALNDLISRYSHDPSGDLKDQIATDWKELRDWQKAHDFDQALETFRGAVRK